MDSDESTFQGEIPFTELDVSDRELRALADPLARHTLRYIGSHSAATLEEVADAVAGFEAAETETLVTAGSRDRFGVRLYHMVLPRLDELGFVRFDPADRKVERGDIPEDIAPLLELAD